MKRDFRDGRSEFYGSNEPADPTRGKSSREEILTAIKFIRNRVIGIRRSLLASLSRTKMDHVVQLIVPCVAQIQLKVSNRTRGIVQSEDLSTRRTLSRIVNHAFARAVYSAK